MKRIRNRVVATLLLLVAFAAGCAQGAVGDTVDVTAMLNGRDLAGSAADRPIQIADDQTSELTLALTNTSSEPVSVRYVRFEGEVIDMIFLTYDTALRVPLAPGQSRTLPPLVLDFFDLGQQADGYLLGSVQLYDESRNPLGSQQVYLDADSDGLSTLEQFNLLLLAATIVGAAWNLLRLAQRQLPANRFVRGLRFLAVGAGAGLTLAVAFSTLRIWPLRTLWWLLFTIVGAVIGYAIGLFLPGSEGDDIDLLDEEDLLEELVLERDGMLVGAGASVAGEARKTAEPDVPKLSRPTVAGDAGKQAKQTVAGDASKKAKQTVAGNASKKQAKQTVAGDAGKQAKQTVAGEPVTKVPKAPGSGTRETVIDTSAAERKAPSTKDTIAGD